MNNRAFSPSLTLRPHWARISRNNARQGYARRKESTLKLVGFFFAGEEMGQACLNARCDKSCTEVAQVQGSDIISPNHARLASVDYGLQAHFGGFFFSGVCA